MTSSSSAGRCRFDMVVAAQDAEVLVWRLQIAEVERAVTNPSSSRVWPDWVCSPARTLFEFATA